VLSLRRLPVVAGLGFGLPLVAAVLWNNFADAQKALNPLAATFLLSSELSAWNFGTLGMRIHPEFWRVIFQRTVPMRSATGPS